MHPGAQSGGGAVDQVTAACRASDGGRSSAHAGSGDPFADRSIVRHDAPFVDLPSNNDSGDNDFGDNDSGNNDSGGFDPNRARNLHRVGLDSSSIERICVE